MNENDKDRLYTTNYDIKDILKSLDKTTASLETRVATLEIYAKLLTGGVGLTAAVVVGLAFWFGSLRTTVADSSAKTDKLYDVVLESAGSLKERTGIIENELKGINKSLDKLTTPPAARNRLSARGDIHFKDDLSDLRAVSTPKSSP
jgi:hypothetical protein